MAWHGIGGWMIGRKRKWMEFDMNICAWLYFRHTHFPVCSCAASNIYSNRIYEWCYDIFSMCVCMCAMLPPTHYSVMLIMLTCMACSLVTIIRVTVLNKFIWRNWSDCQHVWLHLQNVVCMSKPEDGSMMIMMIVIIVIMIWKLTGKWGNSSLAE